jgi:hypothetical protein
MFILGNLPLPAFSLTLLHPRFCLFLCCPNSASMFPFSILLPLGRDLLICPSSWMFRYECLNLLQVPVSREGLARGRDDPWPNHPQRPVQQAHHHPSHQGIHLHPLFKDIFQCFGSSRFCAFASGSHFFSMTSIRILFYKDQETGKLLYILLDASRTDVGAVIVFSSYLRSYLRGVPRSLSN